MPGTRLAPLLIFCNKLLLESAEDVEDADAAEAAEASKLTLPCET